MLIVGEEVGSWSERIGFRAEAAVIAAKIGLEIEMRCDV
jgi:hypothetical protein